MDRLTGLDASFLYLETPEQPMHVCGLVVIDPSTIPGGYSFAGFRDVLAKRINPVEMFTRKLRHVPMALDHPIWVKDRDFHVDRHIHRLGLPNPGGHAELMEAIGHLAGLRLDRDHPLWQMHVIEGYGDRIAVFFKMHHSTVDGVSGANLMSYLCSLEPSLPPIVEGVEKSWTREPSDLELLGRGVVSNLLKPFTAIKLLNPSLQLIAKTINRTAEGTGMAMPLTAPRTSFNGTITHHRTVATAHLDLAEIKAIKNATGTTVNDVVLTLTGGALRGYLQDRGELPETSLLATVPVSVRELSHRSDGSNKISALFSRLGTDIANPVERLYFLHEENFNAKEHQQAIPADALQDWAEFAAPRTFGLAVRAYAGLKLAEKHPVVHNLVVSNVPGPQVPLYFAGGLVDAMFPLGPVFHGAGVNLTVMSLNGRLDLGIIAATEAMPDAADLARRFPEALEDLKQRVERRVEKSRVRRAKKAPAKKTVAKKTPAKKAPVKTAARKAAARKTTARKTPAKKTAARKAAAKA